MFAGKILSFCEVLSVITKNRRSFMQVLAVKCYLVCRFVRVLGDAI